MQRIFKAQIHKEQLRTYGPPNQQRIQRGMFPLGLCDNFESHL